MKRVTSQIIYYNDETQEEVFYKSPLEGVYAYMKHDQETEFYFRKRNAAGDYGFPVPRSLESDTDHLSNWDGFPEMVPMRPRDGIQLTEQIQWFIVAQWAWSKWKVDILETEIPIPGTSQMRVWTVKEQFRHKLNQIQQEYLKEAFRQCFRDDTAFSNHSGIWNKREGDWTGKSYIHDTGGPSLARMWELSCGGSTHKVNSKEVRPDMEYIELMALRPGEYKTWRRYRYDDPKVRHFFFFAVNSTPFAVGTRNTLTKRPPWKADEMHFLGGADVPLPFMSNTGKVEVMASRVEILRDMREFRYPYIK